MSNSTDVGGIVDKITRDGLVIDILVNCAGIQRRFPAAEFPSSDWNEVQQVNLETPFTLCREVGALMIRSGRPGKIINLASLMTYQAGINVVAYTAAKHGIAGITKAFSNEWSKHKINVNAIAPGYIATEMTESLMTDSERSKAISERIPAGRWGSPEDFVGPVIFLASKASDYVCGETLLVDGGWMAR